MKHLTYPFSVRRQQKQLLILTGPHHLSPIFRIRTLFGMIKVFFQLHFNKANLLALSLFILLITFPLPAISQQQTIDSLLQQVSKAKTDTAKAGIYNDIADRYLSLNTNKTKVYAQKAYELANNKDAHTYTDKALKNLIHAYYYESNYDSTLFYEEKRLKLAKKTGNRTREASMYNDIGKIHFYKGEYEKAFEYFTKANKIYEKLNDKEGLTETFLTLGAFYYEQGNYERALKNYFNSLEYAEALPDTANMSYLKVNIGNIYKEQEKYHSALQYYKEALALQQAINKKRNIVRTYNSLGNTLSNLANQQYEKQKEGKSMVKNIQAYLEQYNKSAEYYEKALELAQELNYTRGLGVTYNNFGQNNLSLGEVLKNQGKPQNANKHLKKALNYYQKSLKINKKIGEHEEIALAYQGLGDVHYNMGYYNEAKNYLQQAKAMAEETSSPHGIREAAMSLHEIYARLGNYKKAYQEHKLFKRMVDSLKNEEKVEAITRLEMQYKFDKKTKQMEFEHQAELRKKRWIQRVSVSGLVIVLLFALILYWSYRRKQRDNKLLAQQKAQIEEQKQSITDSIVYAQRIQQAILPGDDFIQNILNKYFILFKPRDIVSGDFYWMTRKNGKIYIASADCTGHGVPGAFMSMLGVSFLTEIVNKSNTTQCNLILEELRNYIITSLHQTGKDDEAKDGMDMAMVIMDTETREIQYAGANNPLYIVRELNEEEKADYRKNKGIDLPRKVMRNGSHELREIKPDKMPIGIYLKQREFTNHTIQLEPNTRLYLFSDGYVDQFGGPEDRKFMTKPFKRLLLSIQDKSLTEQKEILNNTILDWIETGSKYQVDDILLIGLEV